MSRIIPNENSWLGFVSAAASNLAAPVQSAATTAATGGTLAVATYFYVVTATNANGESLRSNEVSITTTGATSTVTVNWAAAASATGYKIYRGTAAGTENVLVATVGAVTTYTDTGAATTPGSPPTANGVATPQSPSLANEINRAVDLTGFLISITANTSGNTVPTPTLKTRFETNIQGTVAASFSADFYRDDAGDLAWTTLPRGVGGAFVLSRFGGKSASTPGMPIIGDVVEVWPVKVTSRSASGMTSNTAEMFTLICSVPSVPAEAASVVA